MQKYIDAVRNWIEPAVNNIKRKIKDKWSELAEALQKNPWCFLAAASAIAIIALTMIVPFTERRGRGLLFLATPLLSMLFIGPLAAQKKLVNGTGSILLLSYAGWLALSRLLLGGKSFGESIDRIALALFAAVLGYNLLFMFNSGAAREKARKIVADMSIAFCMLMSIMSILFVVFGVRMVLWGEYDLCDSFCLSEGRLYCFHEHPNICAEIFVIGLCLALTRAFETKGRPLMALYIGCAVIIFAVLTMTDSRACILVACGVLAVAVGLLFFSHMRGRFEQDAKSRAIKTCVGIICCAAVFFAAYASTDAVRAIAVKINNAVVPAESVGEIEEVGAELTVPDDYAYVSSVDVSAETAENASSTDSIEAAQIEPEMPAVSVSDETMETEDGFVLSDRGFTSLWELMSLNSRTRIYRYAMYKIKENPGVLLFGEQYSPEMILTTVEQFGEETYIAHWHCSYLEVLFETGIIGFLITVAFGVFIIMKICKIFFGSFDKYTAAEKIAQSVPAMALFIGLIEPMLYSFDIRNALLPSVGYLIFIVMCSAAVITADKE